MELHVFTQAEDLSEEFIPYAEGWYEICPPPQAIKTAFENFTRMPFSSLWYFSTL